MHMKRIILALVLAMVGGFSALAQSDPDAFKIFTGIDTGDCELLILTTVNSGGESDHYYATLAKAGGKIYMDEFFADEGQYGLGDWEVYSRNDRWMQTAEFPLPKKTPITVEHTISDLDNSPEWRSVATVSKCNKNPKLTKVVNYRAKAIQYNGSFEEGDDVGDNLIPIEWTPNAALLDSSTTISCGTVQAPVGDCVLQVFPNETKQQLTQSYTPESPIGGKYIELGAFQFVPGESTVKGVIKATLKFANGSKVTLKLTSKKGASNEGYKYSVARATLPAKLVSMKIVITEKGGTSGSWRIDGLSLAVYKKSKFEPSLPERLPLPAAG